MAFPASRGVLSRALESASARALHLKSSAQSLRDRCAAGSVGANEIIEVDADLRRVRTELAGYAATSGIAEYARQQFADQNLDVVAEWQSMMGAIDNVVAWVRANYPVDANGFLLARTWGANGPVWRQFTPAQTAGLRAQLDALIATIG